MNQHNQETINQQQALTVLALLTSQGEPMKKALYLTVICAALTACGGGSGGGNNGGSDPAPSPTPTTQCTLPTIASTTTYYGITPTGSVGTWQFVQNGSTLTVNNTVTPAFGSASSNSFSATANSTNCLFVTTSSGIQGIATAFNGDFAISASQAGNNPAFLIANPTTNQASIAGTYNIVNYEKDSSQLKASSSYRRVVIDSSGTTGTIYRFDNGVQTGRHAIRLSPNASNGFDVAIIPGQYGDTVAEPVGTAFFKVNGSSSVIALAVANSSTSNVTGMWIGSTDSTAFTTGYYVDNNYDGTAYNDAWTGGVNVSSTAVTPVNVNSITFQSNAPQQGFIGLPVDSGQPVDVLISSAVGIFAATTQYDSDVQGSTINTASGPNITFAVRPQQ